MPAVIEHLVRRLSWEELDKAYLRRLVEIARDEDLNGLGLRQPPSRQGDASTASIGGNPPAAAADIMARQEMIACGLPLVPLILSAYGGRATVQLRVKDGAVVLPGQVLATLAGDPRILLSAERIALNFLQRLSGVATQTRRYAEALGSGRTRLLDTRKTTPAFRMLEKYAVACGGGWNHRLGLFDRVMLKDNHLALLGFRTGSEPLGAKDLPGRQLAAAVSRAKNNAPELPVEVEVDTLEQIPAVIDAGADVILLDNFNLPRLKMALRLIRGRTFTEASGGITLKALPRLAGLGLDFVSTGALVHRSAWTDIGLDWKT